MLHEFLTQNTAEIIARTRAKVALRTMPMPTESELKNGVPLFLEQLIDRLRLATTDSNAIKESARQHGGELLAMGFTVSQVVQGYGDVCQAITQLAEETQAPISNADRLSPGHQGARKADQREATNASTQIQEPAEAALRVPVASMVRVWVPFGSPLIE